jgi:hypothetical protein
MVAAPPGVGRGSATRHLCLWVAVGVAGCLTRYFFVFVWLGVIGWLQACFGRFRRALSGAGALMTLLLVRP